VERTQPILVDMAPRTILSKRVLLATLTAVGLLTANAASAQAQAQPEPQPRSSSDSPYTLLFGVQYGAPERISGSVSGLFAYGKFNPKRNAVVNALEIRGSIGTGGYGLGIGPRWMLYGPFGPQAMATVRRTLSSPRHANRQATYVGLEVGYQLLGHVNIGFARQVDGPSSQRDTTLTWSVGVQIPYGFWRW